MKKLLRLFFPLSLRVRFLLATAAVVLVLSLAYGMVALIGYSVSFDKTTFRLLRGESNLFYTLAKWENNKLHVELPENIGEQMIDVLGPEKRRRRTTQEKIAIVQQSFEPGMTVSLVARQHGVAASQLFLWRKQY